MAQDTNYTKIYKKYSSNPQFIGDAMSKMIRGQFYQILEYKYVEEADDSKNWSVTTAPIVYTLFVSDSQDIVHCIKLSSINPITVKQLFKKLVDEKENELDPGRSARTFYNSKMKNMKFFSNNFYRTYKLSGIVKCISLDMDTTKLIPKYMVEAGEVKDGYKTYGRRGKVKNIDTNKTDNIVKKNK
jgi:hypothetical protein